MQREDFSIKTSREEYDDKHLILIIYDIIDNKRRTKFFKLLSGYMMPVQKSCFESHLTDREFEKLKEKIKYYIEEKEDNVRCYKLSAHGKVYNFGKDRQEYIEEMLII